MLDTELLTEHSHGVTDSLQGDRLLTEAAAKGGDDMGLSKPHEGQTWFAALALSRGNDGAGLDRRAARRMTAVALRPGRKRGGAHTEIASALGERVEGDFEAHRVSGRCGSISHVASIRQSKPTTEEEWNPFTATTSAIMADVVAASAS